MKRALLTCALLLCFTTDAHAYNLLVQGIASTGPCGAGSIHFYGPQNISVNTSNSPTATDAAGLQNAVQILAGRVNAVGGQSFRYNLPAGNATGGYGWPHFDGVNEVGIANLAAVAPGLLGFAPSMTDPVDPCKVIEGDVFLGDGYTWAYDTPTAHGQKYYSANEFFWAGPTQYWYARVTLLHELLHTLGLGHTITDYAMMNYGIMPWSNQVSNAQLDLLPDDRQALRAVYPDTSTECDTAVLNTFVDPTTELNGAAFQKLLCAPATGPGPSGSRFAPHCAFAPQTRVCPGDPLYVSYTIANYGTFNETLNEALWFSKNEILDVTTGSDIASPTMFSIATLKGQSYNRWKIYNVPAGVDYDTIYYPIVFVSGAHLTLDESDRNNWTPLVAPVRIKRPEECN